MRGFLTILALGVILATMAVPASAQVELPFLQRGPGSESTPSAAITVPARPAVSKPAVPASTPIRPALQLSLADIGLH